MDRQPLVGVDRGPAKWTPQKRSTQRVDVQPAARVRRGAADAADAARRRRLPTSDEEHNASDAEAPSSKAFASPYAVPASTTLQRERRAWRALQTEESRRHGARSRRSPRD